MDRKQILLAFDKHRTDKGSMLHHYDGMYYNIFQNVTSINRLLEIGVKRGRSLAAWCELFPQAEIVGVDISQREDIVEGAKSTKIIIANSTNPSITEKVGDKYDIIIDDGDHRPEAQWQTFLNLESCWEHVYVIEDVVGIDHANLLAKRLNDKDYKNVTIANSQLTDDIIMSGVKKTVTFFAIIIYRNEYY